MDLNLGIGWLETPASQAIEKIGYDAANQEIHVIFHSGSEYIYHDCDESDWHDFARSDSKGRDVNQVLAKNHSYERV